MGILDSAYAKVGVEWRFKRGLSFDVLVFGFCQCKGLGGGLRRGFCMGVFVYAMMTIDFDVGLQFRSLLCWFVSVLLVVVFKMCCA